jgi:hypothetical protein
MLRKILFKISARMPCRLIQRSPGEPYLERYFVAELFGFRVYLHRFVGCDGDEETHDHPWNACSFVLAGQYEQDVTTGLSGALGVVNERQTVRWFSRIPSNLFHRIVKTVPETWTLFIHRPRVTVDGVEKGWGWLKTERTGFPWLESSSEGEGWNAERVYYRAQKPGDPHWERSCVFGAQAGREPYVS